MFKLIKWIFRIISIVILLSIIFPIIVLVMAYKDVNVPDDVVNTTPVTIETKASERIDNFLEDDTEDNLLFDFTTIEVNTMIKSAFLETNPNYLSEDENVSEDERKYAIKESIVGFKGAWVDFRENGLSLTAGIDLDLSFMTYKTSLKIGFELTDEADQYVLKLTELSIGNFPTLWIYGVTDFFFNLGNNDLTETIQGMLPFGTFDGKEKTLTITSSDVIDLLSEDSDPDNPNSNNLLITSVVGLVMEEQLLSFNFTTSNGGLGINLGKIKSTAVENQVMNPISSDDELKQLFESQLTNLLLANLTTTSGLYFDITETSLNQVIEYYTRDSLEIREELNLGNNKYILETGNLYMDLETNNLSVYLILKIYNELSPLDYFQTHIHITTLPSVEGDDLILTISNINIGDGLSLEDELDVILAFLGESELFDNDRIIIKDFFSLILTEGFIVDDVSSLNNFLRFKLTITDPSLQQTIDEVKDIIGDVLDDLSNTYPELETTINDAITSGDPTDLINQVNDMDPEDQEAFLNDLIDSFTNLGLDINDLIPNQQP